MFRSELIEFVTSEMECRGESPANLIAQAANRLYQQIVDAKSEGTYEEEQQVYELNHWPAIQYLVKAYRALV